MSPWPWHRRRDLPPQRNASRWARVPALIFFLLAQPAWSGDYPEHYTMIFTLARAAGFTPEEARHIASASWAVDDDKNPDTIAFIPGRDTLRTVDFVYRASGTIQPSTSTIVAELQKGGIQHAPQGLYFHALGDAAARQAVSREWIKQIEAAGDHQDRRFLLTGMYLHFVVDTHVHPKEAVEGHFKEFHEPDYAMNFPIEYAQAAQEAFHILRDQYNKSHKETDQQNSAEQQHRLGLDTHTGLQNFASAVVERLRDAYKPENPHLPPLGVATERVGQNAAAIIQSRLAKYFPDNPKGLDFAKYEPIYFTKDASGGLKVTANWVKDTTPIPSADAIFSNQSLQTAKESLISDVRGFYHDSVLTAALGSATSDAAASLAPSALVAALSAKATPVAIDEGQKIVNDAKEHLQKLAPAGSVLYERVANRLTAYAQSNDPSVVRVFKQTDAGVQGYEVHVSSGTVKGASIGWGEAGSQVLPSQGSRADAKVGGVSLDYGMDVLAALDARRDNASVGVSLINGHFRLVSLKTVLGQIAGASGRIDRIDAEARSLAGITRIYGFVLVPDGNDIVLIGGVGERTNAIQANDLAVGLQSVFISQSVPRVSLEPRVGESAGLQFAKVDGIPRNTHFARTLLDADYQMKKIMFSVLGVSSPGFKSYYDFVKDLPDSYFDKSHSNRFWLAPVQPGANELYLSPNGRVVLFASAIQLLTEAGIESAEGRKWLSEADPEAEKASASFTANLNQIERQYPFFERLHGLNDVVLMATLLRKLVPQSNTLNELCQRGIPSEEEVPEGYPGVTVVVRQKEVRVRPDLVYRGKLGLSGGAVLRARAARRNAASYSDQQSDRLQREASALSASGKLSAPLSSTSLVVSAPRAVRDQYDLTVDTGMRSLAAGDLENADARFTEAIEKNPFIADAYALRAQTRVALKRVRKALADIEKARVVDPDETEYEILEYLLKLALGRIIAIPDTASPAVRREVADRLRLSALERYAFGDYDKALRYINWALSADEQASSTYGLRGMIQAQKGAIGNAVRDLDEAIKLSPDSPSLYIDRAQIKAKIKNYEGGIEDLTSALKLDSRCAQAYLLRGLWRARIGDFGNAEQDISRGLELDPTYAIGHVALGMIHAGRAGDRNTAIKDFEQALKLDPGLAPAHFFRAMLLKEMGQNDAAMADLSEAISLDPKNAAGYVARGELLFRRGSQFVAAADKDFDSAIALDPDLRSKVEAIRAGEAAH